MIVWLIGCLVHVISDPYTKNSAVAARVFLGVWRSEYYTDCARVAGIHPISLHF